MTQRQSPETSTLHTIRMLPSAPPSAPASPKPVVRRWPLLVGWILALPGLWVIASFLLFPALSDWAGCPAPLGLDFRPCPPGPLAGLADAMRRSVAITLIASFIGIGILPPLYAAGFVAARLAIRIDRWRRRLPDGGEAPRQPGRLVILTVAIVLGGAAGAGLVARIVQEARSGALSLAGFAEGVLGLTVMGALVYGAYRLGRWGVGLMRGG